MLLDSIKIMLWMHKIKLTSMLN